MSYLVLARKYRPRNFDALVGQPHVVQALSNALTQQRLHHAYLFTGTRGVGKTTISRILAKSLNCTGADGGGGITAQPCGICDACRDIDSGRFIDYVELDAASNRGVDEISQLLDQSVYKPVVGRFKVYMIDEVHMLSNHAFNAMLKTLEEPPDYLKFVLATTDPQKVPPTVLSRCLQFNLRPLAPQTVHEHLDLVLAEEGIVAAPAALRLIARAARGSMRDALSLADQAIAYGAGSIDETGARQMLGAVDRGHAIGLVDALAARDGAALVAAVDRLRELGLSVPGTLDEIAALLQQIAVRHAIPDAAVADEVDAAELDRLAAAMPADETQLLYSIVLHGRAEIGLAPDEYSGLVMVLLRLLAFPPQRDAAVAARTAAGGANGASRRIAADTLNASTPPAPAPSSASAAAPASAGSIDSSVRSVPSTRTAAAAAAAAAAATPTASVAAMRTTAPAGVARATVPVGSDAATAPVAAEAPAAVAGLATREHEPDVSYNDAPGLAAAAELGEPAALGDRWTELVARMNAAGSIGALVRELAMQAQCIAIDDSATPPLWRLRVEREMLRAPAQCEKLQAAVADVLGHRVRIETVAGPADDTPARREAAERARRQAEAEQTIRDDPLVQALMAQYKTARIVPGSVKSL